MHIVALVMKNRGNPARLRRWDALLAVNKPMLAFPLAPELHMLDGKGSTMNKASSGNLLGF